MKTNEASDLSCRFGRILARALVVAAIWFGLLVTNVYASFPLPGGTNFVYDTPLDSWSFQNTNSWASDLNYTPVSFSNLTSFYLGDSSAVVVDSTNPAWLQYNVVETNGTTNLTVNIGTVMFWYAPAWSSTNLGGSGPGEWANLLTAGGYTPDSSFGFWGLYVDPAGQNLCFSAQTNDLSSNFCTYVSAPISWMSNDWHFIVFSYSATNTVLYVDDQLATNGPAITNYPGASALANGFFVGSDSNGIYQAEGMIAGLYTYNTPLSASTISTKYITSYFDYYGDHANITQAGSNPSTNSVNPDAITGVGNLQLDANTFPCVFNTTNAYVVWITNVTAVAAGGGAMNVTFTIDGGQPGYAYDVFANGVMGFGTNSLVWAWLGQGAASNTYTVPIAGSADAFLILGTPQDSDGADLTDAYQALVSHTAGNTNSADGILTGWDVLLGLNPLDNNLTDPTKRANYGYTAADWLNGVSGVKSGTVNPDNEGNVLSVSQ